MNESMKGIRPYLGLWKHLDDVDAIRMRNLRYRILFVYGMILPIVALVLLALLIKSAV